MAGGRNVILAVFQVLLGFRGLQATIVYHRKVGTVLVWKNVAIVGATLLGVAFIVNVGGFVVRGR